MLMEKRKAWKINNYEKYASKAHSKSIFYNNQPHTLVPQSDDEDKLDVIDNKQYMLNNNLHDEYSDNNRYRECKVWIITHSM